MLYITKNIFTKNACVISLIFKSLNLASRFVTQYFVNFVLYFFHKYDSLFRSVCFLRVFSYETVLWEDAAVCGAASVPKYDLGKVDMQLCRGNNSTWVFSCESASYF